MSERTEWPSAERLAELRLEGKVPRAPMAIRGAMLSGVGAVLLATWSTRFHGWRQFLQSEELTPLVIAAERDLGGWVVADVVFPLAVGVGLSLLLNGFFLVVPSFWPRRRRGERMHGVGRVSVYLLLVVSGLIGILYWAPLLFTALMQRDSFDVAVGMGVLLSRFLWFVVLVSFIGAACGALLSRLLFLLRHRMSRREVTQD